MQKRTQQERSAQTRRKVIEAVIDSLYEVGYYSSSTQEICDRALLSKGGLYRQFTNRTTLMVATADYAYAKLVEKFKRRFTRRPVAADRIADGLELIRSNYKTREYHAVLELIVASRTDSVLRAGLKPIIKNNMKTILTLAKDLFPVAARDNPQFDAVIYMLVHEFQGEAIDNILYSSPKRARQRTDFLAAIAKRELLDLPGESTARRQSQPPAQSASIKKSRGRTPV
ncbi:TetR/AcrR family transcriptional regulator [Exilibacterium tricleocarpae]|uniref:TetR/AcrR family transcriptional regulator n=1 Tax=Exilibacterium tricleocarpae TaxID=2591008 RepID=A0A545T8A5_9GAMM|nr:TetR/AcrR family transcriptional regulator [Exilibacterium tricleocarpae]TQV73439.1 TetR/AcrR family transcriptional regulator [Exilibacterium tricleocarpae]